MASEGYHEPVEELSEEVRDHHRAISSLMEEFEAVDWYDQRIAASSDPELKAILAHNRDEEIEHAAMVLEWLRRRSETLDAELRETLFTDGPIRDEGHDHDHEHAEDDDEGDATPSRGDGSLNIGSLKEMIG